MTKLWPFLAAMVFLGATCNEGAGVKVYEHIPDEAAKPLKGFYRESMKESLTYEQAAGYYAVSPQDMEFILTRLRQCEKQKPLISNKNIIDILLGN